MSQDADLIVSSLLAVAEAGIEIRHTLFERFFAAYPERRADFIAPEATSIRMTDETLQMMFGLASEESWVWPLVAELFYEHRGFGDPGLSEYDAFIDMTVEEVVSAAGAAGVASRGTWQCQADKLKAMIRRARVEWQAALPDPATAI